VQGIEYIIKGRSIGIDEDIPVFFPTSNPNLLTLILLGLHSQFFKDQVSCRIMSLDQFTGPRHEIFVQCRMKELGKGCDIQPQDVRGVYPESILNALVMAFHSEHEGHKLRISIDGEQFYPPKELGELEAGGTR